MGLYTLRFQLAIYGTVLDIRENDCKLKPYVHYQTTVLAKFKTRSTFCGSVTQCAEQKFKLMKALRSC